MNQILRCDWLPEQARWSHLARSGLTAVFPEETFTEKPYNKSFINQACFGQDGWILAKFFFSVFMDRDGVEVQKLAKTNLANIQPS